MPDKVSTRSTSELNKEETQVIKIVEKLLSSEAFLNKLTSTVNENISSFFDTRIKMYEDQIHNLEEKLQVAINERNKMCDNLEQYSRRNSLRVYGIPVSEGEKTDEIVIKTCREKLGVDIEISSIDCSHRLPSKGDKIKPILVKFINRNVKKLIYANKKKLKNSKIVIKEDLTKHRVQLLKSAVTKFGQHNVWSLDGNIMVKLNSKIYRVTSIVDLEKLGSS